MSEDLAGIIFERLSKDTKDPYFYFFHNLCEGWFSVTRSRKPLPSPLSLTDRQKEFLSLSRYYKNGKTRIWSPALGRDLTEDEISKWFS